VKIGEGSEPQYVFYTEGTADRSFSKNDIPPKLPENTKCIAFGSIAMTMEPAASSIEKLVLQEKDRRVISFDPNIRSFMIPDRDAYFKRYEQWIAASTIVKISGADIDFLYPGMGLEAVIKKMIASGPRLVLVTLGKDGARALLRKDNGSVVQVSAPIVDLPVVDTIGAGDTFHGAFLAYLENQGKMSPDVLATITEKELYDTLYFANKAASIVCSRRGAEPPTIKDMEEVYW
jgi:fructokinase